MLDESGYTDMWKQDKSIEAPGRLENLKELIHAIEEFENLGGFLEHVSLVMENVENGRTADQLTIMTLHGAKGLEFDVVFLPGWEEGLFPSQRTLDENGLKGLEEERRLAYVGLTRRARSRISATPPTAASTISGRTRCRRASSPNCRRRIRAPRRSDLPPRPEPDVQPRPLGRPLDRRQLHAAHRAQGAADH